MLTPKVFVTQTVDKKPYNVNFVPTTVDDIECYELKSKDFHYGYMTEALANKIFETRPSSKERYVDSFSFETKVKDNQQYLKLKNKIILDLPSKIDEANAFSAFSFYGIKYADDLKKEPIFIKSKIGYSLSGVSSEIEFIFPDNKLNCGGFKINDLNKGLTTIEIDVPNGNIKSINISDLHDSEIANTEVLNFTLKTKNPVANKTIFSFGPMMDHVQKGYDENKSGEAFCSLKNTVVKLNETDFFHNNTSGPLHLINSVVEGTTTIKTSREEGSYSLTIDSSVLNNAQIFLTRENNIGQDVATTISTSEISTFLRANGLKAVRNSIITNGDFNKVDEINDSVCEFVSLDGKDNKILNGYNSVDSGENNNISQTINELEIL